MAENIYEVFDSHADGWNDTGKYFFKNENDAIAFAHQKSVDDMKKDIKNHFYTLQDVKNRIDDPNFYLWHLRITKYELN